MIQLQVAIYERLTGSVELMEMVEGVYDHAPQSADAGSDAPFPYVTIGDDDLSPKDTDDSIGYDVLLTINVWTRELGRSQCKKIQQAIYDALHRQALAVTDYLFINLAFEFASSEMDPDGVTRHGVQRFRCFVDEVMT